MKTKFFLFAAAVLLISFSVNAQVKIGNNPTTINSASLLELETTNQGLVLPRVSLTSVSSSSPLASGLLAATVVYNTNASITGGSGTGIYYWDGSKWNFVANTSTTSSDWSLLGNTNTNSGNNFLGTSDFVSLRFRTNNTERMVIDSLGRVGIGLRNPGYALSVLATSNPLYLSGVQTTSTFSSDSILTINGGVVKKAPYSSLPSGGLVSGWSLIGNGGTNPLLNFIGTTDNADLVFKVGGTQAGYLGQAGGSSASPYATGFGISSSVTNYATAIGASSKAVYQSTAIGYNAQATGSNSSLAVGYNSAASTQNSIAIGTSSVASSNTEALAIGTNAKSTAYQGIALGSNATASTNNQTIAIGVSTNASSYQGVAIGYGASATTNNITLAIGVSASATGYQSTAIGSGTNAAAQNSTAIGNGASAPNANTLILGNGANVGIGISNPSNKLAVLASSDPLYLSGVQATSTFTSDSVLTINAGVVKKSPYSSISGNFWTLNGNAASSGSYLGTTNTTPLQFKFNNTSAGYLDANNTSFGTTSSSTSQYNSAFGYNAQAVNNQQATAIGASSLANAIQSTALGYNAQAVSNSQTTAIGTSSLANSQYSTAIGYYAQAISNTQATAVGSLSTANANQSSAFGYNAQAITNSQTTAIGSNSLASAGAATAVGYNAKSTTNSNGTSIGSNSTTTGQYATAIGASANATGQYSSAFGYNSSATAQNATAIGYNATAANANTIVLGNNADVGIGTSNPAYKLSVIDDADPLYLSGVQATSTFNTDSVLTINAGVVKKAPYSSLTGNFWSITGNAGTSYPTNFLGTTDNNGLHVRTNNVERMVIDSVGSVGIGSTNFDAIREKLLVDNGTTSNNIAAFTAKINDYAQINVQNKSNGTSASSDIVATADNGTDTSNYVDLGINSSTYAPGTENWGGANDAYLYSYSKNLLLGTGKSNSDIIFLSGGGVAKTNTVLRIDGTSGNIIVGKGNNSSIATGNTIRAPNAGGTNIAGGILTLQGGSATGTATGGNVVLNGGTSGSGTAGNIVINTAATERVRVDQSGNVGIGTSSPTNKLSVVASSDPLNLSGVQTGTTADSLLVINNGNVRKVAGLSNLSLTFSKAQYNVVIPSYIGNNSGLTVKVTIPNVPYSATGANPVVVVSPAVDLPDGLLIAWSRVSATNTISINFRNVTNQSVAPQTIKFDISVQQ